MFYEVIPQKLFRQDAGILTYSSDQVLHPGQIVVVPLGKSSTVAIVYRQVKSVDFPTKPITKILYSTPLPQWLLKSILWLSHYYLTPLPQVAALALPAGVTKTRRPTSKPVTQPQSAPSVRDIPLNSAQRTALASLRQLSTSTALLHGITGSGKTNIYLSLALQAFQNRQSTILLVPEIALTSQLVQIFQRTFAQRVVLVHSQQTEAERHLTWQKILESDPDQPLIIIGPRSALFQPVPNLGLIIIDEAHESAYYQENTPKYSALRLASYIAQIAKIKVVQGTATPLITDYHLAQHHHALVTLTEKAKSPDLQPDVHLIDLTDRSNFTKNRYFSTPLLRQIDQNLSQHHQTLIFHNRRGSAPLTLCENCGWQALCPHCFLPLTLHTDSFQLLCHTCGYQAPVPTSCPDCHNASVIHKGFGTKLLESELRKLFPSTRLARFDTDNAKQSTLAANYDAVKAGDIDILIGTQTLAKGLDLPQLATVGIVQADAGLSLPDFAAEERTFHLLTQVLGRIGRGHLAVANAYIQTYQPTHPVITNAIRADYSAFAQYLLKKRQAAQLPPYTYLAKLSLTYKTEATTLRHIQEYHTQLATLPHLSVSAPTPAFHERTTRGYTWQLVLKSTSRAHLLSALQSLPANPHLHFAIDPPSLL